MPVDISMYGRGRAPDLLGGYKEGLSMKRMAGQDAEIERQRLEDHGTRDAFKNNLTMNPDGTQTVNRQMLMSDLAKVNGAKAYQQGEAFKQQDSAAQAAKMKQMLESAEAGGQLLGGAVDQQSYNQVRQQLISNGIMDEKNLPPQFDPNHVKGLEMRALSAKERLDHQIKEQELKLKKSGVGSAGGGSGKAPSGYRYKPDGSLEPIPGGPESQKALGTNVPGATVAPGATPTKIDAEKMKQAIEKRKDMMGSMNDLEAMLNKNGTEWFSAGNAATDMSTVATDIRMTAKELYDLGALSGPDMGLIEKVIPDPTDAKWAFTWNSTEKAKSQLKKARDIMERASQNVASSRGYQILPDGPPPPPAQATAPILKTNEIEW